MHFNNKRINRGDSQSEIKDKVNYNFNQVLSFGIGHEGLIGPKGATGIPGPSGKIGETGSTGNRASDWFRGNTVPATGDSQEFDLWVDDSSSLGDIYERGFSSWSYTGLSLFNSDYFEVYSGIVGPLGLTDKSAIGFKSSYVPDQTSLVVSDTYFSSSDVNPNNSKLLVSTEDQITNPIFSFVKSNSNSTSSPSFYWKNTGVFSDLLFKSPGKLSIISLLDLELSSYQPSGGGDMTLNGSSFYANTLGNVNILSNAWLSFITSYDSQTAPFILSSLNIGINSSKIYTKTLTQIFNLFGGIGNYILKSVPESGSTFNYFGGISINSDSSTSRIFDFTGMDGHSVLYGLPSGSVSSGNHKQIVFGASGGGSAGSTGAPYSYHVKRLNNIELGSLSIDRCIEYNSRNSTLYTTTSLTNVLDISTPSKWNSNMIVCTWNYSGNDQYIRIPSSIDPTLEPVFYNGEGNEYRVYLNDEYSSSTGKIKGILYSYRYVNLSSGTNTTRNVYKNFSSTCSYVDLFWAYKGSNTNPNGKIFWKTCSGEGGFLEVTNAYTAAGNNAPLFPSSI